MNLVDSHAHLEGKKFDADRDAVLERARAAGVNAILAIGSGTGPGSLDCALRIADQHDWIFATIGIHPHEAALCTEPDYAEMEKLSRHPKCIAWGEIGFDYYYDHSPRGTQRTVFLRQLELARAAKKPIVIHCRPSDNSTNAWDDTFALLEAHWARTGFGGILHCFTGNKAQMQRALDIGFLISFSGMVTFPKLTDIRECARECPLDRMLIETDSPFLAPVPHRGQRNEPAFVSFVAQEIAALRGLEPSDIAEVTSRTFRRFFSLPERQPVT